MRAAAILLAAFALPLAASADPANWRTIHVDLTLLPDGSLSVVENASVLIPSDATVIRRRYWSDSNERITAVRIEPDGTEIPQAFTMTPWGQLELKVPAGGEGQRSLRFRVETRVTGVVSPVWSVGRGVRQLDRPAVVEPFDRLREIAAMWRDAAPHRYLLDYQFFFPEDQNDLDIQPSLTFAREWKPAHPIDPEKVATVLKFGIQGHGDSLRVHSLVDYGGASVPAAVDFRAHRIRMASIAAFPIAAILIWLAYFGRRVVRRPANIDEQWVRDHVLSEAPEVITARWGRWPPLVLIETFLRRMERAGKIALDVCTIDQGTDDEQEIVDIRLRVPREKLSEYERLVIDDLMPKGNSVDSRQIRERHEGTDFDPMDRARKWLNDTASKVRSGTRSPRLSRFVSFAVFFAGMWLIVLDSVRAHNEPIPAIGTLIFLSALTAFWSFRHPLLTAIPLVAMCAFLVAMHTAIPEPLGVYAPVGVVLALLGSFHALVAHAAADVKPLDLVAAEAWLRKQDHRRAEWRPYLEALGIEERRDDDDAGEEWGYLLSTFTESADRQ